MKVFLNCDEDVIRSMPIARVINNGSSIFMTNVAEIERSLVITLVVCSERVMYHAAIKVFKVLTLIPGKSPPKWLKPPVIVRKTPSLLFGNTIVSALSSAKNSPRCACVVANKRKI